MRRTMSLSSAVRLFMAWSGFSNSNLRFAACVKPCKNRLSRRPFALRSRSKTYLLKQRDGHRRGHGEVVVRMHFLDARIQRAAHDQPHHHLGALVAAETREVSDRHAGQ